MPAAGARSENQGKRKWSQLADRRVDDTTNEGPIWQSLCFYEHKKIRKLHLAGRKRIIAVGRRFLQVACMRSSKRSIPIGSVFANCSSNLCIGLSKV